MNAMKPILFNTDMVRALQNGTKTVTRRVAKPQPTAVIRNVKAFRGDKGPVTLFEYPDGRVEQPTFPYLPGDILYVRETFAEVARLAPKHNELFATVLYAYKADGENKLVKKWRPSIHMPREAARIFLRVTDVWVERLQDITEAQTKAEGAILPLAAQNDPEYAEYIGGYYNAFADLWDSTVKKADRTLYGWDASPWVWVIEFERCEKPEEGAP